MYLGASESAARSPRRAPVSAWLPLSRGPPSTRGLITGFAMLKLFSSRSKQTHLHEAGNSICTLRGSPGSPINREPFHYTKRYIRTYVRTYTYFRPLSLASERSNARDQRFALKNAAVSLFSYRAAPSSILDGSLKVIERDIARAAQRFFSLRPLDRRSQIGRAAAF